jgi:Copper binding proteins, plastocyanin/azurin family
VYTEGNATVVRMDVCSFAPTIARVPVGTEVRFLNTANIEHMVLGRNGTWGSQVLQPGMEYSEAFTSAGTYPFECPLHPGMVGAIVVGGGVDAVAAAAGGVTASTAPAAPASAASTASAAATTAQAGTDPVPILVAGAAGLAAGAIGGALVAVAAARRRATGSTTG